MLTVIKNLKPLIYLKNVFSGSSEASFGRFGAGSVLFMTHAWITFLVVKNHALPDMTGPSAFLTSGVVACYGTAKVAEVKAAKDAATAAVAKPDEP